MSTVIAGDLLRTADFPNGIATASDVQRLGALLNPRLKRLQALSSQGVNAIDNLDAQVIDFQVATPASAVETVAAIYNLTSAATIPNATPTVVNFANRELDTNSAVTTGAAWVFTCPPGMAGLYRVAATVSLGVLTATADAYVSVYKNGTEVHRGERKSLTSTYGGCSVAADVQLVAGDTLAISAYQNSGAGQPIDNSTAAANRISIARAGPIMIAPSCFPQPLRITDRRTPLAVLLLSCQDHSQGNPAGTPNSGTNTPSVLVPGLQWSYLGQQQGQPNLVSIDGMPGLALGRTYDVSVMVLFR